MKPPSSVANRTRSRKTLFVNTPQLASRSRNETDAVSISIGHRNRKRLAGGGIRVRDCSPQLKSGFDRRQEVRDFVVVDNEVPVDVPESPVARRTRSRLRLDMDVPPTSRSAASVNAVELVPTSCQESITGELESDGSGCFADGKKDSSVSGGYGKFRVSSQSVWSIYSMTVNEAADTRRTRSSKAFISEDQMIGRPVVVDLDKKQSSNDNDPTISTSGLVSGASVCEEESSSVKGCGSKGEIIGTHLKRKTFEGLAVLVPVSNDNCNTDGVVGLSINVAKRTRSHRPSQPNKNIGTIRNPYRVDVDSDLSLGGDGDGDVDDNDDNSRGRVVLEDSFSSETDDNVDEDASDDDCNDFDDDAVNASISIEEPLNEKAKRKTQEDLQLKKPRKRKRSRAPKKDFLFKTFVDTILTEGKNSTQKTNPQNGTLPVVEIPHPLTFSFENVSSEQKGTPEMKKGEEDLWIEFNVVMSCNNIGSFSSSMVNNEETKIRELEIDPSTLCCQGKHEFIFDEQIGIVCRFCPYVKLEIKHVLPSLGKSVWGKSSIRCFGSEKHFSSLEGLPFQNMRGDPDGYAHCKEGTVWDIVPGIKRTMYPHQQEGFEFMWKNLAGSIALEDLKKPAKPGDLGGCVISHAPGTGKTRLTIVFLQTFMKVFPNCRPLILAPRSMILTWEKEFKKWEVGIPLHILNRKEFSGKEDCVAVQLCHKYKLQSANWARLVKIFSWDKGKSILVLSYSLFERLVEKICLDEKEAQVRKILLEKPGLLVLDEGHTPRNEHSLIWKALEKMKTERRIILSGTPFQNNFGELYNTLCLVRPKFADKLLSVDISQRKSKVISDDIRKVLPEKKEARGKWASLTNSIGKSTNDRLEVLRSVIDPFVHVHKGSILNSLPGLRDCLVYLHPPPLQKRILESLQKISGTQFKREYDVSMISIHPSLLMECSLPEEEKSVVDEQLLERLRLDPSEGVKTRFVMELVRLSASVNEKVLVFSQYIQPLSLIKDHLKFCFHWIEGKEVLQMDGNVGIKQRQLSIDSFNDPSSDVRVLLASTKACCEGINLIGASRVVLLDVVWNPSVERQAISRAYRLGQQKLVYTYHLITSGTTEGDKYYRQVEKDRLSELIFSSGDVECDNKQSSLKISEDRILEEMVGHDKMKNIFEKILYQPKKSTLMEALEPTPLN